MKKEKSRKKEEIHKRGGSGGGTPWPAAGFTNFLKIKLIDSPIFDY